MQVFLTGATGVLGKATIPLLIASGHQVHAFSHSEKNTGTIRQLGAEPITADLFDRASLTRALAASQATAIVHLATRIPPTMKMGKVASWQENDHIRRDGTRILVDVALAAGVQTFVYPSFYYVYPDRSAQWIDASSTPIQSHVIQQATIDAEKEVERFTSEKERGIVLRLGNLYGPDVPSALEQFQMAQKGIAALPGPGNAYLSYIWAADAASAIVVALDKAPAGIYDIVDDEPLTRNEFAHALAQSVGKRRLLHIPNGVMKMLTGAAADMVNRSQRVSNRRFRELTGWKPTVENAREGWALIAKARHDAGA
ncbi:nucleoside-diphosphate sugar epimerase [Reticulibacter mediterranei]|uniref:Nucleoside-diphosphate sugar epimerase n=1 Tax=Reticulibacter mediterranei TaxID=2778369 RepID=A0A8J3N810_9CHLR|nr:NAD(P)-dependent oxidoreductase [Reticulibacter mediterranei]GHO99188.1 nucleoside-diphosphate sugar epimerase [Reticulibacter mediterranei]